MQTLYALATTQPGDAESAKKKGAAILGDKLDRSLDLFIIALLYTFRTAQYAEKDAAQRASKYLPTPEDLNVNTKISGNEFMWQILSDKTFTEKIKQSGLERYVDDDWIKKIYLQLVRTGEYKQYISEQGRDKSSEKNIIRFIWEQQILSMESLMEHFTEELPGWEDDGDMTIVMMQNFFKEPDLKINFLDLDDKQKRGYAVELMNTVIDKEEYCMSIIKPKLNNWDPERVAMIDVLLLRMGVCEFLFFSFYSDQGYY